MHSSYNIHNSKKRVLCEALVYILYIREDIILPLVRANMTFIEDVYIEVVYEGDSCI